MKKVRKLLHEILHGSLLTEQINHLGRDVDPKFSVAAVSGYGDKIVIPRQVAATCVIDYFNTDERLLEFVAYMLSREGQGATGGIINLKGTPALLQLLKEHNWVYDREGARFQRDQSQARTADWGFMKEGQEYHHSFASIDIVASSNLIKTNIKEDVEVTMARLRKYIYDHVEKRNGRVWSWYGDGGIAAFYGEGSTNLSVISMIQIISYLPIFNISQNELRPETDIKLRVGMHFGTAVYKTDISKILSPDLKMAMDIEKNCASPNSVAITDSVYQSLRTEVRAAFAPAGEYSNQKVYLYNPV